MINASSTANRQIARAAGVVMAAFILSNLTGLARQILISDAFGTDATLDAFNAAARLPETLFSLVAGGALASAFIPTFTGLLEREEKQKAWYLVSAMVNLVSLTLVLVSVLAALLAPQVVGYLLAPNFSPASQALTASILRILLISPVIFGVSGLLMGVLNTHQHFLLPALAPSMHWVGWIIGVLFFVPRAGIHGLAWGAVLGAGLHLGIQLPGLLRVKGKYVLTLGLDHPPVRKVIWLMGPRVVGVAVVQINFWVNVIIASGQPTGSLSAINFAWAIMMMPQVVIAQAIAIAALPTFSSQVARGRMEEMRLSLAATLRSVILLSLPATIGLALLRQPIVTLLFERGAFDAQSRNLVSWALLWYATGLVGHSVVEIVARAFYAMQDTRTPVAVGAGAMTLNVLFSLWFSAWFLRLGWAPHGGLALANSLATSLEMVGLMVLMRRRLGGLEGGYILRGTGQAVLGSSAMALGLWLWGRWAGEASVWISAAGGVIFGFLVYAMFMWILRVPEARDLWGSVIHWRPFQSTTKELNHGG